MYRAGWSIEKSVRQSHTDTHGKVLTKPYCRCGENIYTTSLCEFSWNQNWSHVTMNRWILFVSGRKGEGEILALVLSPESVLPGRNIRIM